MICNNKLEYLDIGKEFLCIRCGKKEIGYVYCSNNHYICDDCHGKDSFDLIQKLSLSSKESNPLIIAEKILEISSIPMLGCEHAWITAGSFLTAIRNHGEIKITDNEIREALNRTKKQAIGAYCGLTGICGIAPAIGACFSVILGAACPKNKETATTMHVVSHIIDAIANETGPCCCKNFMRTSLIESCYLAEKHLNIKLPHEIHIVCKDNHRHPHGCRETKCSYFRGK
ncbi:hypothetical protein SH2C18_00470 [Clostridium sediminicola]